jgi:hypothetical protein
VSQLKLASESGSVFDPATQGEFRDQIKVINDALRQLAGNGVLAPGDTTINDPLNAPYILHVNPTQGGIRLQQGPTQVGMMMISTARCVALSCSA